MATTIEAVDAIQRALENEGLLQSIRAQLRAGVFNIISKKSGAGRPARSVEALQSREGLSARLCLLLIFI